MENDNAPVVLFLGFRKKVPIFVTFYYDLGQSEDPQIFTRKQAKAVFDYLSDAYPRYARIVRVLHIAGNVTTIKTI